MLSLQVACSNPLLRSLPCLGSLYTASASSLLSLLVKSSLVGEYEKEVR